MSLPSCTLAHTQSVDVQTQFSYDDTNLQWMVAYRGKNTVSTIPDGGGVVNNFETTTNNMNSFVFRRDGPDEYIYYCSTNGSLYKRNVLTDVENLLSFPTTNIKCAGHALNYHAGRDSLIFIYQENGLFGIAEYKNP